MAAPTTTLVASPNVQNVLDDMRVFVQSILGTGVPCIKGIVNRVPAPIPQGGFVVLTPIYQERLEFNIDTFSTAETPWPANQYVQLSMRIDVQCDVYGSAGWAGTWAAMIVALWRDEFACNLMVNSQPLYADEARMIPLLDSEQQYEERWAITLTAQFNPIIQPPLYFAQTTDFDMVDVENL
jgi:hypothetical protein